MSILFTAFEPSGDAHAAPVIRALLDKVPGLKIYAWGGPKMAEAGATVIEETALDGAMGLGALTKVRAVRREVKRIGRWIKQYRILAHVAVDSPAANFPIAKMVDKSGARVIHLVAPQLWAWGGWRIRKLRRVTDLVLCLLPFEEGWFRERDVPARFIGHPAINRELDEAALLEEASVLPQGAPRVALLPGSRSQEVKANIRLLVDAYTELQGRHAGLAGTIVAANPEIAALVRRRVKVFPRGLHMVTDMLDPALAWADLALAVSGTVTLHVARHRTPMVGVYKGGIVACALAKLLIRTPYKLLPNLIADREIVPEFVPHFGGPMPIVQEATRFLLDSRVAAVQSEELHRVCLRFVNKNPAQEAARYIVKVLKTGAVED